MSRRRSKPAPRAPVIPVVEEQDEESDYVVDEDETESDVDDEYMPSSSTRAGSTGVRRTSSDHSMSASKPKTPRRSATAPPASVSRSSAGTDSKTTTTSPDDMDVDIHINVERVVHEFKDMFGDEDEDVNRWLEQLQTIEEQRLSQSQDEITSSVINVVSDFKAQELLQKLLSLPVAVPRVQLFGNGIEDDQLVELVQQRAVELPLFKSDFECALLREAGTSRYVPTNKTVVFPPCCNGDQCMGTLVPLQVSQPEPNDSKSSSTPSFVSDASAATATQSPGLTVDTNNHLENDDGLPTKALVLMQILYPDEFDTLTRNGSIHVEPRPCVLCMRYRLYDFVLCLRSNRRDELHGSVPDPNHIREYQLYRSLVDEPGGYRGDQMVKPDTVNWEGFADPFVAYRYPLLRAVYDTRSSCWFVDQRALMYEPPSVATPQVGEKVSHFHERGIASMHAQVPCTIRATTRALNATRASTLLAENGLTLLQKHLVMSRHASAASPPVTPTRLVRHGQQHVRRLASLHDDSQSAVPNASSSFVLMRLREIRQAYSRRRKQAPLSPGTGSHTRSEAQPDVHVPLAVSIRDHVAVDLFIAFVLGIGYQRMLFYPSTVCDIWPYLHEAALFRSSRARVDAVVHLINKCLPQRCQSRKSNAIFTQFFKACLKDMDASDTSCIEMRRRWVVAQWITVSMLGNWNFGSRTRSLLSTANRKLWLKTVATRPRVILRFLADFPRIAICGLQEYVARSIVADHALAAHLSDRFDLLDYADACSAAADRARLVLNRIMTAGVLDMNAGSDTYEDLRRQTAQEMETTKTGMVTDYAYYRERRSAWQILCSQTSVLAAVRGAACEYGVDPQHFDTLVGATDSAVGASKTSYLDPVISETTSAVIRGCLYKYGREEYTAHTSVDVPLRFMRLAVLLCACEGLGALAFFEDCATQAENAHLGERRIIALLRKGVRKYPRTSIVLVWLSRVYAFYASSYSVLLRPHHFRAQARALTRFSKVVVETQNQNQDQSQGEEDVALPSLEPPSTNSTKHIELDLEHVLLQRCRSCKMVCTLIHRLRKLYKWSYDHGYRNLHLDITSMRIFCKNYQNPDYPYCSEIEPIRAVLLGRLFRWQKNVYTLCGAPNCGAAMEWDPHSCLYRKGVYYCRPCTEAYHVRQSQASIDVQCDFATRDCVYCGRSLLGLAATNVVFAPYNQFMCSKHMENHAVSSFMRQNRWADPIQESLFANSLAQTKRMIRQARQERLKPHIDRAIARSKQKTAARHKH